MSRLVSFIILAAIVIMMAGLFIWVMFQFVLPIFVALVLVVIFRPLHRWLTIELGGRVRLAALLTTLAALLVVLVPAGLLVVRAASEGMSVAGDLNRQDLLQRLALVRAKLNLSLPSPPIRARAEGIASRVSALADAPFAADPDDQAAPVVPAPEAVPALDESTDSTATGLSATAKPAAPPATRRQLASELTAQLRALESELDREERQRPRSRDSQWEQHLQERSARVRTRLAALEEAVSKLAEAALVPPPTVDEAAAEPTAEPAAAAAIDAWETQVERVAVAHEAFRRELLGDPLRYWLKLQANPEDDQARLDALRAWLEQFAGPLALSTTQAVAGFIGKFVVGLCILLVSLYYFLADGSAMVNTVMRLTPLDRRFGEQMLAEFDKVSRAVVVATFLSALVQGILAGIGFFVAGIGAVFLLSLLTMVLAMVPFVGAAAVWGSCALWLLLGEGRTLAAALLALYGMAIVSTSDNVIKPLVLHGQSNIHPLLALLSVLGGVTTLGPIGIFVGPMVVAFLHALLIMLQAEITALSGETPPSEPTEPKRRGRFRLR